MAKRKVGKISNDEKEFIRKHCVDMADSEIALAINRSEEFVKTNRNKMTLSSGAIPKIGDINEAKEKVKKKLKESYAWQTLKQEFTTDEINSFVELYTDSIAQFRDLTPTEDSQLMDWTKFNILKSRELIARKRMEDKISSLEEELEDFGPNEDLTDAELARKDSLDGLLSTYRANSKDSYNSYIKFEEKKEAILSSLKATRDKRLSKIDKIDVSWPDIIKQLEDEETKDIIGLQLGIGNRTYKKEFERLAKPHTFTNGTVDQLLLNTETCHDENGIDDAESKTVEVAGEEAGTAE